MLITFIIIVIVTIFSSMLYLNYKFSYIQGKELFTIFVILATIERLWETFFTTKEKSRLKLEGDWTLVLTNYSYLITCVLIIFEFYFRIEKSLFIVMIGVITILCSSIIRFKAIKTLDKQWAIHVIGKSKLIDPNISIIVESGPYKYIRHPIYLAVILEFVGFSLIANAFFSLIFIFLISVPLQILRAKKEEESLLNKFGDKYFAYKKKTPFLIPNLKIKN